MTSSNITALLSCPDKKGQVDVYADGELVLTLSEDAVFEAGLRVGDTLDEQRLCEIEYTVTRTKAKAKAYGYLSYGDLSASALCKKLIRYGFSQEIAQAVCEDLTAAGYIDDARYALALAGYLANTKLYGPRRILQELYAKGVDRQISEQALYELDADFESNIKTLVAGKLSFDRSDRKQASKAIASLVRYGYDYDMISEAIGSLEDDYE